MHTAEARISQWLAQIQGTRIEGLMVDNLAADRGYAAPIRYGRLVTIGGPTGVAAG